MARMQRWHRLALLLAAMITVGCEYDPSTWDAFAALHTSPKRETTKPDATSTEKPEVVAAPVEPSPTADLAASPEVASVQQDIDEFINRFPESELQQKVAGPSRIREPQLTPIAPPATTMARNTETTSQPATAAPAQPEIETIAIEPPTPAPAAPSASANPAPADAQQASPAPTPAIEPAPALTPNDTAHANAPLTSAAPSQPQAAAAPQIAAIEIAPVPEQAPPPSDPARMETNRALASESAPAAASVQQHIEQFETDVAERPNDLDALFRLRMLYLAEGMDDKAVAPVAGLNPEMGALVQSAIQTLVQVREAVRDPFSQASPAMDRIQQLSGSLRTIAPVTVDRMLLVSRVNSYGDYEPFPNDAFTAGQANRAILYAEISNFASQKHDDGRYHTQLGLTIELFDEQGNRVWEQSHASIPDVCRRLRHDFFLASEVDLPASLPAGQYTFKTTVEDKLSATADQAQLTITLKNPEAVATSR